MRWRAAGPHRQDGRCRRRRCKEQGKARRIDDAAGLVSENVTIVYSYASDEALKTGIHKVLQFAHEMKSELKQSAVSLEVNGELYLI